jgi:HTH-type transcriptional regulator / antitoxin HigA
MDIKLIKTDADYRAALTEIETLMAATLDSPQGDRLDLLVTLVEAYERYHYPMDLPEGPGHIPFDRLPSAVSITR